MTVPAFASTSPGEPTPTPASASVSTPAWSAASVIAAAIAAATSAGPALGRAWGGAPARHGVVGVDDDRLDLRAAEVDAAARGARVRAGHDPACYADGPPAASRRRRRRRRRPRRRRGRRPPAAPARAADRARAGARRATTSAPTRSSAPGRSAARSGRSRSRGLAADAAAAGRASSPARRARSRAATRRPVVAAAATGAALSLGAHRRDAADLGRVAQALAERRPRDAVVAGLGRRRGEVARRSARCSPPRAAPPASALMRRFPRAWWAPGAAVVVGFGVADDVPRAGRPRPDLQPLHAAARGPRARATSSTSRARAGVDVGEVYEVDASRRTTAANAYVNGLGRTKRVVLFDTLMRDFTRDEVRLVVAHELGHVRHDDVRRLLAYLAIVAPAGTLAVARVTEALQPPGRARRAAGAARARAGGDARRHAGHGDRQPPLTAHRGAHRRLRAAASRTRPSRSSASRSASRSRTSPSPSRRGWAEVLFGTHPTTLQRIGAAVAFRDAAPPADRRTPAGS